MPRRPGPLALLPLLLAAGFAPAQDLPPPSPTDLARGLREAGLPDLALEYLDDLSKTAPADLQKVLPLERAKCRLKLAATETDDSVRGGMAADAKREFGAFVKANPGHPRLPEAAVAVAQLQTIEGKAQLQRSRRVPEAEQAAEAAKARPFFQAAAKQYEGAADGLKKLADKEDPGTARHKELIQDYLQAVLDRGVNLYLLADSYSPADAKLADERAKAAKEAGLIFEGLGRTDAAQPLAWVGRAWAAETLHLVDEHLKAETAFKDLIAEAQKVKTTASAAGLRMARFFQLREDFGKNGGQDADSTGRLRVRKEAGDWLREFPDARPSTEEYAARYYLGTACVNEGLKRENLSIETVKPADPKDKPTEKILGVRDAGLTLLREADAQFHILVRTENEYTDRATRQRAKALRWLVGNPDRPPAQFATFDDCYMAALVQLERVREATGAERDELLNKVIALLERADTLPVPPESARDAARARLELARTYVAGHRPQAAAVYAEHLARTARSPSAAARAALIALAGYQTAADQTPSAEAKGVDRDRMIALGVFAEKAAADDPMADEVRLQLGILYSQANRPLDMFEVLARIPPRFPRLAQARLYEGLAAFDLIRPPGRDEAPRADDLPADKKQSIYRRAVTDMGAVPEPGKEATAEAVRFYINMRLQLAQLHLTQGAKEYPTAEPITVSAAAVAAGHPALSADDKLRFALRCERQRLREVYGQAMPLYVAGKYAEAAERFDPLVKEVLKAGPAVKGLKKDSPADVADLAKGLDADRISLLLVPSLNARVREGAVAKTGELLDELKKFGGDLSTTARVVQQGVASIKPTVDALKKDGKGDEADRLIAAVAAMVSKLAQEKDLPTDVRLNLGRSFKDLGEYGKAAELLEAIPPPDDREALKGELPAKPNETDDEQKKREADNAAAGPYRLARLELARTYRLDKKLDKAAAVLDDALGKEGAAKPPSVVKPREGGWGTRYSDFRREGIHLIEARAAAADKPIPLWNEALANWRGWVAEYKGALDRLNQPYSLKKRDAERLAARVRVCDDLSGKEKVDFDAEKAQAVKDLEQAEKDREQAEADLPLAVKALEAAGKDDADKAREKVEQLREAIPALTRKAAELRAAPAILDGLAKKPPAEWAEEGRKAQKELEALQKEMGDQERKMNPLRAGWADLQADLFRCLVAANTAVNANNATELDNGFKRYATAIADFEKANRSLSPAARQKLFDLIDAHPKMKEKYREAGGTDSLTPPGDR